MKTTTLAVALFLLASVATHRNRSHESTAHLQVGPKLKSILFALVALFMLERVFGEPPEITQQPQDRTVNLGANVSFLVSVTNSLPAQYEYGWFFNGFQIAGAKLPTFAIANAQAYDAGTFVVAISNATRGGAITSSPALLRVLVPTTITNFSRASTFATLSFQTEPRLRYTVEARESSFTNSWISILSFVANTNAAQTVVTNLVAAQQFFRLKIE